MLEGKKKKKTVFFHRTHQWQKIIPISTSTHRHPFHISTHFQPAPTKPKPAHLPTKPKHSIGGWSFELEVDPSMGRGEDPSKWRSIGAVFSTLPLVGEDRHHFVDPFITSLKETERPTNGSGLRREKLNKKWVCFGLMINSSSWCWASYCRKVRKKKNYTDDKAGVGGFGGFIAKCFVNIRYSVVDEDALNWPKSSRRINLVLIDQKFQSRTIGGVFDFDSKFRECVWFWPK